MSAQLFISLLVIAASVPVIQLTCAYLIMMERKVAAYVQDRYGPNRTNFSFGLNDIWGMLGLGWLFERKNKMLGLGQALADGLKLVWKEDYTPANVDKVLFYIAPMLIVVPALVGAAVIPWGGVWDFPGLVIAGTEWIQPGLAYVTVFPADLGVIYLLAVSSLGVYGVVLGAYASNNKYSFLGGLRATAQMLSYEIPLAICVLIMIITYQSASTTEMTLLQMNGAWGLFAHPMIAVIFFICGLAECNRAPFDLAESEQELVGGFHTEYGSLRWALFFLAEYMHMITSAAFFTLMFLGGSDLLPGVSIIPRVNDGSFFGLLAEGSLLGGVLMVVLQVKIYALKVFVLLWLMMMVRWTLPRFRFDQLMKLAWRGMIPLMLVMLLVVTLMVAYGLTSWWMFLIANIAFALTAPYLGYLLPKDPPINRRIPLEGSRFSPAS
ncbi:complex I subunit 1/NuoH family protein [Mucisphaera calidilacus]|uniref:NADH-quinone oxidoreductase subunit H n=1 Tax=Mucisphaera calidilacus TaxID=2527982 RepID=A0A518BXA2_9BACT|nr:complex I subunit 1 family protein [Mucisphaera calidilacus]QDU71611.1 NADH-quinone oxidoreductase subunit 8 [Mucisphaera calidilacus]